MAEKASRTKSTLGGKKKKSSKASKSVAAVVAKAIKRHVHKMHISRTDNGKFLVDHEFKNGPDEPTIPGQSHALNPEELAGHVAENFGVGEGVAPGAGSPELPPAPGPEAMPAGPLPTGV
jgi:hypothetical protein